MRYVCVEMADEFETEREQKGVLGVRMRMRE